MTFKESRIHFVGIGGTGMCGIARMLLSEGKQVSGSDITESAVTRTLARDGITVTLGQRAENITADTELVVISAAIKPDNPEVLEAKRLGIPVQKYAQVVGRLMNDRRGIAVSGTHGKTTTSAMVATVLHAAGLDPSFVIGAAVGPLGGSSHAGKGKLFVVEACEYDRSFHNYFPSCAVINNIEKDHLDYYTGGLPEIVEAFGKFASQVKREGVLVVNRCDAEAMEAAKSRRCRLETFGLDASTDGWSATDLKCRQGFFSFRPLFKGKDLGEFEMGIPGVHNVSNALAAMACCRWAGVKESVVRDALRDFHGADRRFQIIGSPGGVTIVDDYAHHPTEIRVTLKAAREFFEARRVFVVFQPHQHSRTRFLLEEFAQSFKDADVVLIPDIYFVRDSDVERRSVSSQDLVAAVDNGKHTCLYLPTFEEIRDHLVRTLKPGDVVITMGAGDINKVGWWLAKHLEGRDCPIETATL
jgi:UDP-N-acetylmuramate--alanine ligase